jgi:hypothetical protein
MPLIRPDGLHYLHRDDYDAIERVNFSTLSKMARSPAHYRAALTYKYPDTDALRLGRVTHLAVFEPERFPGTVAVWDGGWRRGKDWERFKDQNEGRELLTVEEHDLCLAMAAAVRNNPHAAPYVSGGHGEVTMCWTAKGGGGGVNRYALECKGRIDFDAATAVVNLKTTKDAQSEAFARQSWNLRYHTRAAWESDGYALAGRSRKPYVIVAVEKMPPFEVVVYRVPERHLELGREEYRGWLDRLAWCRETSRWPGYAETELELELPRWVDHSDEDLGGLGLTSGGDPIAAQEG